MIKAEQLIDVVLTNYGLSDRELFRRASSNVSEDELREGLKAVGLLEFNDRTNFFWDLQNELEKQLVINSALEMNELVEVAANAWNKKNNIEISPQVALNLYQLIHLKYPNWQKAFKYLCDGDLESYKTFGRNNHKMTVDLFMRFAICNVSRMNAIIKLADELLPRFSDIVSKKIYFESLDRLGFLTQKKRLNFKKMSVYKGKIGRKNLVFAEGMRSILLENMHEEETEEVYSFKKRLLAQGKQEVDLEDIEVDDIMENFVVEANEPGMPNLQKNQEIKVTKVIEPVQVIVQQTEVIEEQSVEQSIEETIKEVTQVETLEQFQGNHKKTAVNTEIDEEVIEPENVAVVVDHHSVDRDAPDHNGVISDLEELFDKIRTTLEKAKETELKLSNPLVDSDSHSLSLLKIAEEENRRLKVALQQEQEKVGYKEEKAYAKILEAIGGKTSNYLLSDLCEESQGILPNNRKISSGRLVNLFSSLSLAIGLEEHSAGYELGDVFSVEKDTLIKNFMIDGPITSSEETVQVKLLKYGWTINGKVFVQPLVKEEI